MEYEHLQYIIEEIRKAQENEVGDISILEGKIKLIKNTYLNYWKDEHLPYIKQFYEKINMGIPTPVLSICGRGTQEIRYTKYLTYFLNPKENHGLHDRFLRTMLEEEVEKAIGHCNWTNRICVESEKFIGDIEGRKKTSCYCDIVITADNFVAFIEQKVLSSESLNVNSDLGQLKRYSKAINNNSQFNRLKQIKLYLSPNTRQAKDCEDWISLSHKDIIIKGLNILKDNTISNVARHNLKCFLLDLAMGPYQEPGDIYTKAYSLAQKLFENGFTLGEALEFSRWLEENQVLADLIMEG